ncbi:threonine/homoserine exporter RhtA [Ectopseudomonas khazarica]|uniref:Threonine/homoserine exporter RhtA n=1 Tax=Ectopseudomonas khazarica TaxID=2502979 RepID=A0ABW7M7V7_9GAMM|nr:threonine/homoserine exporter RhtA [Pseudomonas khazarica]QTS88696.1 threonine/homoserine exporter RhtA [Pseudomonas khazarica]
MPRPALLVPIALLVVAMTSIQSGASLAKNLFPLVGAEGTTALRLVLGAIILSLVMQPWRARLDLRKCHALLAYGLALGGMNLLFYMSLQSIPLGIAVALEFTGPLALALFSSRRLLDFVWVILAIAGLWLLLPTGATQSAIDPLGAGLALGAGVCWSLYIIFGQKAGAQHGRHTVALGTWVAALLVLPVGLWHAGGDLFDLDLLPIALGVAVMSSALPYSLEMIALTRMPARTFSVLMSLEPAIAALCGLIFLGEKLLWGQWLAVAAIIIASTGAAATIKPQR